MYFCCHRRWCASAGLRCNNFLKNKIKSRKLWNAQVREWIKSTFCVWIKKRSRCLVPLPCPGSPFTSASAEIISYAHLITIIEQSCWINWPDKRRRMEVVRKMPRALTKFRLHRTYQSAHKYSRRLLLLFKLRRIGSIPSRERESTGPLSLAT